MMKKLLLGLVAVLGMSAANAQYFHHTYVDYSLIGNGVNTRSTGDAHLMGAVKSANVVVVRTDIDGNFTSAFNFNNTYSLANIAGVPLHITANEVLEFSDGSGYAALASYTTTWDNITVYGVVYLQIGLKGKVTNVQAYEMIPPGQFQFNDIQLTSTYESTASPGDIYATGRLTGGNEQAYIFNLRIRQNGGLLWGNIYDFILPNTTTYEHPHDIIESPYNSNELYLVGTMEFPYSTYYNSGSFHLLLDANTGAVNNAMYYDFNGGNESFEAISVSDDPNDPGFVISGWYEATGCTFDPAYSRTFMVVKTDRNLNFGWQNLYNDMDPSNDWHQSFDVKGRLNTMGNYEYYVVGQRYTSMWDVMVLKLDDRGNVVPGGLFDYDLGDGEYGVSVDVNTSGTADGISVYCHHIDLYPTPNLYIVKAYFNGVSGCNEHNENAMSTPINLMGQNIQLTVNPIRQDNVIYVGLSTNNDHPLCYSSSLSDGDNSLVRRDHAANGDKFGNSAQSTVRVYPNPLTEGDQVLGISLKADKQEHVTVSLIDMLGRQLVQRTYTIEKGTNELQADLGSSNIAKGVYNLLVERDNGTEVIRLSVKK